MIYFYLNPNEMIFDSDASERDWHKVVPWGTDEHAQAGPLSKDQNDLYEFCKSVAPQTMIPCIANPRGVIMKVTKEEMMQMGGTPAGVLRQQMENFLIN